jgi:glycosyltransferase involved in cell wall biosynthesis
VAIDAPLDPFQGGGVESYVASLLAEPALASGGLRLSVLAPPRQTAAFRRLAGARAGVVPWVLHELRPAERLRPPARGKWIRDAMGPLAGVFDAALAVYRRARYGIASRSPTREEVDRKLAARGIGLVHFATPRVFSTGLPTLYEPWDLLFRHYPDFFAPDEIAFRESTYRLGCERAALVITATRWVKQDLVAQFGLAAERVAVVPRGSRYAQVPLTDDEVESVLADCGVCRGYALYPAMSFEHKNHLRLIEALALLRNRSGHRLSLVLSGRPDRAHWPRIERRITELELADQVILLGAVPERTLAALYRGARLLVFPSLFEGLGLPILEALAHRLPVLASRETCIPEVAGDAARYFDGRDAGSIAQTLERALADPDWLRAPLEAAERQLAVFNTRRAVETLHACYRKTLGLGLSGRERELLAAALG